MTLLQGQYKNGVSVDPQEIEHVEFKTTRLKPGYDPDEVDHFLDKVGIQYRQIQMLLDQEKERTASLRRELAEANRKLSSWGGEPVTQVITTMPPVSVSPIPVETNTGAAVRILEMAQKTADEVVERANADALAIEHKADEEAQKSVAEAQQQAQGLVGEAYARKRKLEDAVEELASKHEDLRLFLKQHLENGLAELEANKP